MNTRKGKVLTEQPVVIVRRKAGTRRPPSPPTQPPLRVSAPRTQTEEMAISEQPPERFLGGCLRFPQLTGAGGLLRVPHLPASSPSPPPTPAGERRRRTLATRSCRGLRVPRFDKDT